MIAGTNKTKKNQIKIGAPADSINGIVVNSVNKNGVPASYSREGPVLSFYNKPDVSYYGGEKEEGVAVFSYDKVLNFEGETGPYAQYTLARCNSLLSKTDNLDNPDYAAINTPAAFEVVKFLDKYPKLVAEAADKYEPSLITRYIIDLAESYNKFYFETRILDEDKRMEKAKLNLTQAVKIVLDSALALIGVKSVERM